MTKATAPGGWWPESDHTPLTTRPAYSTTSPPHKEKIVPSPRRDEATRRPTPAQRALLDHIAHGKVARVYHARAGWAVRLATVRSRGAGGGLGRKVDSSVRVLAEFGWAYEGDHDRRTGYIWHLTEAGRSHLEDDER